MRERASIALIHNGELLLLYRFKHGQEYYCLPGGGIDQGETAEQAAIREMKEEANIDVIITEQLWKYQNDEVQNLEHILLATDYTGTPEIVGYDKMRQSDDNYYRLEWIPLYELKYTNLLPVEIKNRLIERFGQKWRWDKLVRDNVPEYIESRGRTSTWHVADDKEYETELIKKLREEVEEFIKLGTEAELADVEELLEAMINFKQFDRSKIDEVRAKKKAERGGYTKRIILEESTGE